MSAPPTSEPYSDRLAAADARAEAGDLAGSEHAYAQALKDGVEPAALWPRAAATLLAQGRFSEAARAYAAAGPNIAPRDAAASGALQRLGFDGEGGAPELSEGPRAAVRIPRPLLPRRAFREAVRAGDRARDARNWNAAAGAFERAVAIDPLRFGAWVQLGHMRKEAGRYGAAESAYGRALQLRPDDADLWLNIALLFKLTHRLYFAAEAYAEANRLAPGLGGSTAELASLARAGFTPTGRLPRLAPEPEFDAEPLDATPQAASLGLTPDQVVDRLLGLAAGPETETPDLDAPGALSIVVQGGLGPSTLVPTAVNLRHWRTLFPAAELIFSISVTDVLESAPGQLDQPRLTRAYAHDGLLAAALREMCAVCDKIVLSDGALPLPPFKNDSGPNNGNLQLAAAKAGLAQATGRRVLRIRSDAVLLTRAFALQHARDAALPRGRSATTAERVLISPLFTLNPFTVERLPLHFSDWFHYGLREDVTALWVAEPMSLADGVHHKTAPHPADANSRERQFHSRLAIEQHLLASAYGPRFPELRLHSLTEPAAIPRSLEVLRDDFVIADLDDAGFVFDKYRSDRLDPTKQFHCLWREDWLGLVLSPDASPEQVLARKISAARASGMI